MIENIVFSKKRIGGPSRIRHEHPYLVDTIHFSILPTKINAATIAQLYLGEGLSSSQIAEKLNLSKTAVLERLRSLEIRKGTKPEPSTDPKNYRAPNPPYGYRIVDGQLAPDQKEIKVCRLIVGLIRDQGLTLRATGRELESRKIKNRRSDLKWGHSVIKTIYARWHKKI